ncbi:MAG: GNAT family N-acetyltransferase [Chloroflexi bacterium]|nr:GNAT family N-acetyltransferase [Chloroflexota bacterium]
MSVCIRPMEPRDIDAVCSLIVQLSGHPMSLEDMADRLAWAERSPIDWLFVGEVDGCVAGLLGFRLRENLEQRSRYGEISVLVTDSAVRRQGVGRALMDFAEQMAREQGCIGTWLVSGFKRKDEAHRFYESLGYQTTGYRFVKRFDE